MYAVLAEKSLSARTTSNWSPAILYLQISDAYI